MERVNHGAQIVMDRLTCDWSKLLSSATCRIQEAATVLTAGPLTWLETHISQTRVRAQERRVMTRLFNAALSTCYRHHKISKREVKEAKKKWKEAMRNVKEEDKRRAKSQSLEHKRARVCTCSLCH